MSPNWTRSHRSLSLRLDRVEENQRQSQSNANVAMKGWLVHQLRFQETIRYACYRIALSNCIYCKEMQNCIFVSIFLFILVLFYFFTFILFFFSKHANFIFNPQFKIIYCSVYVEKSSLRYCRIGFISINSHRRTGLREREVSNRFMGSLHILMSVVLLLLFSYSIY